MICPRCTVAEISESGHCALCGFSPSADVILQQPLVEEVQQIVQDSTADRFRIEALLRLGERSLVYLAHEVAQDRLVALKVIPVLGGVTQQLAHAFERQAQLGQSLHHAHIVTLHAFGATATFLWYTLDHVREPSLGDLLRESGPLGLDRCLGIAEQVASALDYAHRRGVPHGNLKPSNIFLDERWVRVADFAILDAFGRQAASGTGGPWLRLPEYMAPEQFYARAPLAGADQYALAVVIYQCLTGTPPFIGDSFEEGARRQAREHLRRAVAVAEVAHVYQGAVMGLDGVARLQLGDAVRTHDLPVRAAGQHPAGQARSRHFAARDRDDAASPERAVADFLRRRERDLGAKQPLELQHVIPLGCLRAV